MEKQYYGFFSKKIHVSTGLLYIYYKKDFSEKVWCTLVQQFDSEKEAIDYAKNFSTGDMEYIGMIGEYVGKQQFFNKILEL
jgi:hypothetical protein